MIKHIARIILTLCLILTILFSFACSNNAEKIVYTMVNVCDEVQQGDSHILRFKGGKIYVIDAGGGNPEVRSRLASYLKKRKIKHIDKFFMSHAHRDHYEGIVEVMKAGIKINEVYFNIPDKNICISEEPHGCDYQNIVDIRSKIKQEGIILKDLQIGDVFNPQEGATLQVLYVSDGINSPVGKTDINGSSAIMRLDYGDTSVLFTGDLSQGVSDFLATYLFKLKADILKVPHHGTEGTASDKFFDRVNPKVALIPSPKGLWDSDRSKRIRNYFEEKKVPTYISGTDGDVNVILWKNRYEIIKGR